MVALTGAAQWVGHHPANRKVTGSIADQGTCQFAGQIPDWDSYKRQPIDVSLAHQCFSPSPPLSKNKYINNPKSHVAVGISGGHILCTDDYTVLSGEISEHVTE